MLRPQKYSQYEPEAGGGALPRHEEEVGRRPWPILLRPKYMQTPLHILLDDVISHDGTLACAADGTCTTYSSHI